MLACLTSSQWTELEAFLYVEEHPTTPEDEARLRDEKLKDIWARFKRQKG